MRILFCVGVAMRAGGADSKVRPVTASLCLSGRLLDDLGHDARPDRAATLADGEAQALVHGDRLDELDLHLDVVARHDHLRALGQVGDAGHVGRAEVELGPIAGEERRVAAALLLLEDVDLGLELGVRGDRARLAEHLAALDVLTLGAAQQAADVVAGLALIEDLAEHLDAGHDRRGRVGDADDLDVVAGVDDALLDAAGRAGAAAGDGEDVLDRHQERLVEVALGLRDVAVELLGELDDLGRVLRVALERLERRAGDERDVVAGELVLAEEVADLDLDEFEELLVVDHVGLVEEDHDVRHAHLAGEQDVLARLRHRAVGGRDHEDRAVHLGGAGDHVLDVVGVTRAVHVGVVALVGLVLDVRSRDRDAALLLLRSVVDLVERAGLAAVGLRQDLGDGCGQRRLAMVDVTDGPDVDVRLAALELLLCHCVLSPLKVSNWGKVAQLGRDGLSDAALDDLLRDVGRDLVVAVELHRGRRAALRVGAEVGDVAEHLRQRDPGGDRERIAALVLALDAAATARQVADDLAQELLGRDDLHREDRLEQDRLGPPGRLLEGERAGDLERDLRRVGVVVLAVDEGHADVDHRVAGAHAGLHGLLAALLDGRDELGGHGAALDLRHEVEALAGRRLHVDVDDAELARAAGLLDEAPLDLGRGAADGLAVGDLWPADVGLDLELALHAVDEDLEVQLAHPGDLGLAGLLVGLHLERRVLLGQAAERDRHLLLVGLGLRLDGDLDDGLGELDHLELDRRVGGGQRVAGDDLLDAHGRSDVTRVDLVDLLAVVGVHHEDAPDPLGLAGGDVENPRARAELAGVRAEVGELADEGVGRDLERKRRERLLVGRLARDLLRLVGAAHLDETGDRRDVERAGQVVEHGVEQWLDALVLERAAAEDRRERDRQRLLADRGLQRRGGYRVAAAELLECRLGELVVELGQHVEQVLARVGGLVDQLLRDVDDLGVLAEVVEVADGLHPDQVDDPGEVGLRAPRQLHGHGVGAEAVVHGLDGVLEARADAVHLVDERDARDGVLVGLAPDGLGLRLDAGDRVEQRDRAVEYSQRALDLDGEVHVPRRVDDVDPVIAPLTGRRGGGDGDPALLLLLHPVHRRGALVDLTDLVRTTRVVEDALRRRRLAGVDVRHDPDVAGLLEAELAWHEKRGWVGSVGCGSSEGLPRARAQKTGPSGPHAIRPFLCRPVGVAMWSRSPSCLDLPR